MSKIPFILALALGVGLSAAWAAEVREKTSPPSPDRSQIESMVRQYAESLLRQYDKNKNGVLEKDEWSQMPERWRGADRNGDGIITLDELVSQIVDLSRPRSARPRITYPPPVSTPPISTPPPFQAEVRGVGPSASSDRMMSETLKMSDRPLDPRAPMVEMRMLVAELAADGVAKSASPAGPATAGGGKAGGSGKPGGLVDVDLAAPIESLKESLAKIGLRGRWESFHSVQLAGADGQVAVLNVGQSEPEITGMTQSTFGRTNSIQYHNTGFIVGVQPRVDRGGIVTVEVSVNGSRKGSDDEGTPMFVSPKGETIVSHPIHQMISRSIVRAPTGKTVVVARIDREEHGRRRELVILLSVQVSEPKAK